MSKMVIRTLRMQAWERAKGELSAMLQATWPGSETPPSRRDQFTLLSNAVEAFIGKIESEALHE